MRHLFIAIGCFLMMAAEARTKNDSLQLIRNKTGSPLSITLLGNLYGEATILAATKAFRDKTDFNKQHPPLFNN